MNTRTKGKKLEKIAKEILESEGYIVEFANPKLCFIGPGKVITKAYDLFGKWDCLAVKENSQLRFIQVGVWDHHSTKIKQVRGFPTGNWDQEIWLWCSQGKNSHFKVCRWANNFEFRGECKMKIKKMVIK